MDLKFTDEQDMLRETTQALCRDASGMDVVRQMENDPIGIPEKLWTGMREAGLTGIFVPEEYGGTGLDFLYGNGGDDVLYGDDGDDGAQLQSRHDADTP